MHNAKTASRAESHDVFKDYVRGWKLGFHRSWARAHKDARSWAGNCAVGFGVQHSSSQLLCAPAGPWEAGATPAGPPSHLPCPGQAHTAVQLQMGQGNLSRLKQKLFGAVHSVPRQSTWFDSWLRQLGSCHWRGAPGSFSPSPALLD